MDKNIFFAEHKLSEDDLIEANITWDALSWIEGDYHRMNTCTILKRRGSTLTATG